MRTKQMSIDESGEVNHQLVSQSLGVGADSRHQSVQIRKHLQVAKDT